MKIKGIDYKVTSGHALFILGGAGHGFHNASTKEPLIFLRALVLMDLERLYTTFLISEIVYLLVKIP